MKRTLITGKSVEFIQCVKEKEIRMNLSKWAFNGIKVLPLAQTKRCIELKCPSDVLIQMIS